MTTEARVIATASTTLQNAPKFGGTRDEIATVTHYPDAGVVAVEVEHYDGARVVEFDYATWAAFREAVIANGAISE